MAYYPQTIQSYVTAKASRGAEAAKRLFAHAKEQFMQSAEKTNTVAETTLPVFAPETSTLTNLDQGYSIPVISLLLVTLIGIVAACAIFCLSSSSETDDATKKSEQAQTSSPKASSSASAAGTPRSLPSVEAAKPEYNQEDYDALLPRVKDNLQPFQQARRKGDLRFKNPYTGSSARRDQGTKDLLKEIDELSTQIKKALDGKEDVSKLQAQFDDLFEQYVDAETVCCALS